MFNGAKTHRLHFVKSDTYVHVDKNHMCVHCKYCRWNGCIDTCFKLGNVLADAILTNIQQMLCYIFNIQV